MKRIGEDTIAIHGLSLFVRIGCTEEERSFPQRLSATIQVALDSTKAARSGNLTDTVCYVAIRDCLQKLVAFDSWKLLEELSEDICKSLFENFRAVRRIQLRLQKFVFPDAESVSLEIVREP